MGDVWKAGEYDVDMEGPRQCDVACFSGACPALRSRRVEAAWSTYRGTLSEELQRPLVGSSACSPSGIRLLRPHCSYSQNSIGAWSKNLSRSGRGKVTTSLQPRSLRFAPPSAARRASTCNLSSLVSACHPPTDNDSPPCPRASMAPCHWLQESSQEPDFDLKFQDGTNGPANIFSAIQNGSDAASTSRFGRRGMDTRQTLRTPASASTTDVP